MNKMLNRMILYFCLGGVFLFACTTRSPTYLNYEDEKSESLESESKDIEEFFNEPIEVVTFETPQDAIVMEVEETPVSIVHRKVGDFTVLPKKQIFDGGAVVYNYVENHLYQIFLAPRQLTHLSLEEGEIITAPPAAGDTYNFMVETTQTQKAGKITEHVLIKAVNAGNETTLVIATNRRVYHFRLCAFERTFMPIVYFHYPMSIFEELEKKEEIRQRNQLTIHSDIRDLDFSYEIIPHDIHMPEWAPSMVFNDGSKTYMQFHSAKRTAVAPALFEINSKKEPSLLNYRVTGDYYIVDQVIEHAQLVVDINEGNLITIKRMR